MMAKARGRTRSDEPRRLPRGRHALTPEEVQEDQRCRLIEAVPRVVAEQGYEAMSVADIVKAAAVSRSAFYANFGSKQECFMAAHEACHERLLGVLEARCEQRGTSVEERVETAVGAALAMLATEPEVGHLLFLEAPGAGPEIALRYYEWLRRYGTLLRAAIPRADGSSLAAEVDQVIVGGIASRVAGELLEGQPRRLRSLTPHLVDYVLTFCEAGASATAERRADDAGTPASSPAAEPRRRIA